MYLSPMQRECIRHVYEDGDCDEWHNKTLNSLEKRGLIVPKDYKPGKFYILTMEGKQVYNQIMSSGDGPEALKEMFNPGMSKGF